MLSDDGHLHISTFCTHGGCVGVSREGDAVVVVDRGTPEGPRLRFSRAEWAAFVAGVKAGEFDVEP